MAEKLSERDIMQDCLVLEKHLTETYNAAVNETAHNLLRSDLISILTEEHQLHSSVFGTLDKHGWYLTRPVTQEALSEVQSYFKGMQGELQ
ncbi:MAG: spore coat protein [Desulfofundulus sp.]